VRTGHGGGTVDAAVRERAIRLPANASPLRTAPVRPGIPARRSGLKPRQSHVRAAGAHRSWLGAAAVPGGAGGVIGRSAFRGAARAGRPRHRTAHRRRRGARGPVRKPLAGARIVHARALNRRASPGAVPDATAGPTGVTPKRAFVERGHRGHGRDRLHPDPETGRPPRRVLMAGRKALEPRARGGVGTTAGRRARHRPPGGDRGTGRNHIEGGSGDRLDVRMAAIGLDFRRIPAWPGNLVREIRADLRDPAPHCRRRMAQHSGEEPRTGRTATGMAVS